MAVDENHPGCFRDAHGELWVTTADRHEAITAHRLYDQARRERAAAAARIDRRFTRVGGMGAIIGAATAAWAALGLLQAPWPAVLLLIVAGLVIGASVTLAVANPALRRRDEAEHAILTRSTPLPPGVKLPPVVIEHAPEHATAMQLAGWSQIVVREQHLSSQFAKARNDAELSDRECHVAPGDRSTWFYHPDDLSRLETEYADARRTYEMLAAELGFVPRPESSSD